MLDRERHVWARPRAVSCDGDCSSVQLSLDLLDRATPPIGGDGRARRRVWWTALALLVTLPVAAVFIAIELAAIVFVVLGWNLVAATVRRAHDFDSHGLLPVLSLTGPGFAIVAVTQMASGAGFPIVPLILSLLLARQLLDLGFKKGTAGPNRFGERAR